MRSILAALAFLLLLATPAEAFEPPAWADNASIYEVNVRQFSAKGDLASVTAELPRLKRLGVSVVWLMPLQPIGTSHRKGRLGSYYSIRDYTAVNPEFGTLADVRRLVATAHRLGMKVILDWVANHTAWDSAWVSLHPEWYRKDAAGGISGYTYDNGTSIEHWDDVVGLDYGNKALWPAMIEAMRFWLRETGIDGFRCDVAGMVPTEFWLAARAELDRPKPLFWLAEGDKPDLARAFDAVYDWTLYHKLADVGRGKSSPSDLAALIAKPSPYPQTTWRMRFTSNHDENSWNGSDDELYGPAADAMAVLAATLPGIPLVYNGQEAGLHKRLAFFEKDPIDWGHYARAKLYRTLLALRRTEPALASGPKAGALQTVETGNPALVAYRRAIGNSGVLIVANLSGKPQAATNGWRGVLPAWGYVVLRERAGRPGQTLLAGR